MPLLVALALLVLAGLVLAVLLLLDLMTIGLLLLSKLMADLILGLLRRVARLSILLRPVLLLMAPVLTLVLEVLLLLPGPLLLPVDSRLTSLMELCLLCGVRVTTLTRRLLNVGPDRIYKRDGLGGLTLERLL